jgi:2-polyprenyl-6-methoxyphenol hydroxylase-like FAD-dependent oxidoreductase
MTDSKMATDSRRHALVIGGSITGLLAARVLSDHFEQVTVVERDRFPDEPQWRPGVPQSHHAHVLLTKGQQILEELFPIEGGRWIAILAGIAKDYPPTDEAGFLDFARTLRSPVLYEAIKDAQPISPIYSYRRTENCLRHYEKLSRFPENFIAIGDAVCAFNPVYGQGMTIAALGALTLNQCLKQQQRGDLIGLAKRFQKQLAKVNATPWMMATSEDFRWETTEGGRPNWVTRLMHHYLDQVLLLAIESPKTYNVWLEVLHLKKTPTALFQPGILMRLLGKAIQPSREGERYIQEQEQSIPQRRGTQQGPA